MTTIEEKAREYAHETFLRVASDPEMPWDRVRDTYVQTYLAGAQEALRGQWRDIGNGLPEVGREVVWHCRVRTPKGTWLDAYISDRYDGEYMPDNTEHWMLVPAYQ